ncbi:MAG TPA: signal peptide peptidase SppA [Opitutaceae bacterium]|nr:signal peptide peptidase SppA [Opitutaceae bacterium]
MKNFFASLFGSLVALVIFFGGCAFLGFVLVVALAAMGQRRPTEVAQGSYLVFDLSANIQDAPPEFDGSAMFGPLFGGQRLTTLQLRAVTHALRAAAKDHRIAGVLITGNLQPVDFGSGYGALKEVRAALLAFKASGKPIVAYLDEATTRDYYLASAADEVVLDPFGAILLPGLASTPLFMAGAFEKFGVGVQVTRVGKYKSAVEPYTRKDLSPEAREELQNLLNDLWTDLVRDIAASRQLSREAVQHVVDTEGVIPASSALAHKLVDRTAYRDEIIDELKVKTGRKKGTTESFKQVSLSAYAGSARGAGDAFGRGANRIAVIYAEGEIVDGEGQIGEVGGHKFARELRRLRQDDDVKAIVLRVNSPGGSATASEEIQREIRLTMQKKPVVVSMGSVAASGGYWISTYADRIFAEPTTITGSIGVFGMFINVQQLFNNLGLTFDTVKTGQVADLLTISRPKTEAELAIFQKLVDWIYDEFTTKVAESRKLDKAKVLEIAQGRVWSGVEAKKLGLVDEIGGLGRAIAYAAQKASLGTNYRLTEFPRKKQLAELINELLRDMAPDQAGSDDALMKLFGEFKDQARVLLRYNDPRGVYARLPVDIVIH